MSTAFTDSLTVPTAAPVSVSPATSGTGATENSKPTGLRSGCAELTSGCTLVMLGPWSTNASMVAEAVFGFFAASEAVHWNEIFPFGIDGIVLGGVVGTVSATT